MTLDFLFIPRLCLFADGNDLEEKETLMMQERRAWVSMRTVRRSPDWRSVVLEHGPQFVDTPLTERWVYDLSLESEGSWDYFHQKV